MDPLQALREILSQMNELSGAGLDLLEGALGGGGEEGPPPGPDSGEGPPPGPDGGEGPPPGPPGAPA